MNNDGYKRLCKILSMMKTSTKLCQNEKTRYEEDNVIVNRKVAAVCTRREGNIGILRRLPMATRMGKVSLTRKAQLRRQQRPETGQMNFSRTEDRRK